MHRKELRIAEFVTRGEYRAAAVRYSSNRLFQVFFHGQADFSASKSGLKGFSA
jgi:hypothetical protein